MVKVEAAFIGSALLPEQFPRVNRPEIAFLGRSNVGKSSLLNALLQRKELARTSGKPGKTQTLNFLMWATGGVCGPAGIRLCACTQVREAGMEQAHARLFTYP